jgi:hypothetical protein
MQDESRPQEKGERKFGLSKGIFNIGEDFEFTEKETEDLFDLGAQKE